MKKILFFIENNWAFGRIHNDLIKCLYPDIHCDIIDWRVSYRYDDFSHFMNTYDYVITTPHGGMTLTKSYNLPASKIIIIAHSNSDFQHILFTHNLGKEFFEQFKGYAVISPILRTLSIAHGIKRLPQLLQIGCFNNIHIKNNSKQLKKIGYVGATHRAFEEEKIDIKRGHLIAKIAEKVNLPLVQHKDLYFLCSTSMYCDFDILMFSSLTEGLPTVLLEAFSSGIPVIGTDTGVFPDLAKSGGGIILPFEENEYINQAVDTLNELKNNPEKYQHMSMCALEKAREHDWSIAKASWINFINSLYDNESKKNIENYCIMEKYISRENPLHFDDRFCTDEAQNEVYEFAKKFLNEKNFNTVVDIGCGSGFKLIKYFNENNTIGIETEPCLSQLKEKYPSKTWINSGIPEESFSNFTQNTDIIICSDVIEHIKNPNELINYIKSFKYKYVIISTPDRKILRHSFPEYYGEVSWWGPPKNPNHVREWTFDEFDKYLKLHFKNVQGFHCSKQIECMFFVCED